MNLECGRQEKGKEQTVMITNTPALGVCPHTLCFPRSSLFPFRREPGETRLAWLRLFAPEPTSFSQNLEFEVGNACFSHSWSPELGTCKP